MGLGAKAREQLGLQIWFARVAEKGYIARAKGKVTMASTHVVG